MSTAIQKIKCRTDDLKIFTDGSGFEGHVGAAAVADISATKSAQLRYTLGTMVEHIVFDGEVIDIFLALQIVKAQSESRFCLSRLRQSGRDLSPLRQQSPTKPAHPP